MNCTTVYLQVFRCILCELLVGKDFSYLNGEQEEFIRRILHIRRARYVIT